LSVLENQEASTVGKVLQGYTDDVPEDSHLCTCILENLRTWLIESGTLGTLCRLANQFWFYRVYVVTDRIKMYCTLPLGARSMTKRTALFCTKSNNTFVCVYFWSGSLLI
jgi:hypothetical protein